MYYNIVHAAYKTQKRHGSRDNVYYLRFTHATVGSFRERATTVGTANTLLSPATPIVRVSKTPQSIWSGWLLIKQYWNARDAFGAVENTERTSCAPR